MSSSHVTRRASGRMLAGQGRAEQSRAGLSRVQSVAIVCTNFMHTTARTAPPRGPLRSAAGPTRA